MGTAHAETNGLPIRNYNYEGHSVRLVLILCMSGVETDPLFFYAALSGSRCEFVQVCFIIDEPVEFSRCGCTRYVPGTLSTGV
mgnify:FL=1